MTDRHHRGRSARVVWFAATIHQFCGRLTGRLTKSYGDGQACWMGELCNETEFSVTWMMLAMVGSKDEVYARTHVYAVTGSC